MIVASSLAFFLVIFLVGSILTAVAWMAFLKMRAEESDAAHLEATTAEPWDENGIGQSDSVLLRRERFSSITFLDSLLNRFDFVEILKTRCEQAQLNWTAGRVISMMLLISVLRRAAPSSDATMSKHLPTMAAEAGDRAFENVLGEL